MTKELVLIVEDDLSSLDFETASLETAGLTVDGAGSAEAAREKIARRRPDLILMDIQLPGMDGLEATRRLKAASETAGIPVIALTAFAMREDAQKMQAAGCDGYLAKPYRAAQLLEAVNGALAGAAPVRRTAS